MALKEKIPTPTDIVNQTNQPIIPPPEPNTISSKNESKDFTPEELTQIQHLQKEMNQVIFNLGQLKLSEIKLESSRKLLESNLKTVEEKEKNLANSLNKKYGKGTLDIETGKFTPTK